MNKKTVALIIVLILQLFATIVLTIRIANNYFNNHEAFATPLSKDYLIFPKNTGFKYFYELKPNTTIILKATEIQKLGYPQGTVIKNYINSDGLNQLTNYTPAKSRGIYRILTIGDSFTYGMNVNTTDNYPFKLEKKLSGNLKCKNITKFEVINLGVPGYDVPYTIERYKLIGEKYNPDLLIWLIVDLKRDNEKELPEIDKLEKYLITQNQWNNISNPYAYSWNTVENELVNSTGKEDKMIKSQLADMKNLNKYYKGPLLLLTIPDSALGYNNIDSGLISYTSYRQDTFFDNNLPDIYKTDFYSLYDSHPSPQGYSAMVNNIYDYLTKNNIIPCEK